MRRLREWINQFGRTYYLRAEREVELAFNPFANRPLPGDIIFGRFRVSFQDRTRRGLVFQVYEDGELIADDVRMGKFIERTVPARSKGCELRIKHPVMNEGVVRISEVEECGDS